MVLIKMSSTRLAISPLNRDHLSKKNMINIYSISVIYIYMELVFFSAGIWGTVTGALVQNEQLHILPKSSQP